MDIEDFEKTIFYRFPRQIPAAGPEPEAEHQKRFARCRRITLLFVVGCRKAGAQAHRTTQRSIYRAEIRGLRGEFSARLWRVSMPELQWMREVVRDQLVTEGWVRLVMSARATKAHLRARGSTDF